ncbi:hypothetical protein JCM11251_006337 [Rhodosporidiobolus azoricus]
MIARTVSFAGLVTLLVALLNATAVHAAMAQGTVDLTRDMIIQYDTRAFASTEAFCKSFRSACVNYVGPQGEQGNESDAQNHTDEPLTQQLDCVFSAPDGRKIQEGLSRHHVAPPVDSLMFVLTAKIHAFCGGLEKNADGTWTNGGQVTDYTKETISRYFSKTAKVKGGPTTYKQCEVMRKKNKNDPITCSNMDA